MLSWRVARPQHKLRDLAVLRKVLPDRLIRRRERDVADVELRGFPNLAVVLADADVQARRPELLAVQDIHRSNAAPVVLEQHEPEAA